MAPITSTQDTAALRAELPGGSHSSCENQQQRLRQTTHCLEGEVFSSAQFECLKLQHVMYLIMGIGVELLWQASQGLILPRVYNDCLG